MDKQSTKTSGHCLCGGVSVTLPHPIEDVGVCHCHMCQVWGGGPWMAYQEPAAKITGDTLIIYKSSSFAERGFCSLCGAHIFHRPNGGPELAISAGLFDNPDKYIDREIFVDSQPKHYGFSNRGTRQTIIGMAIQWLPKLIWRNIRR